jgi:hypothetical protein
MLTAASVRGVYWVSVETLDVCVARHTIAVLYDHLDDEYVAVLAVRRERRLALKERDESVRRNALEYTRGHSPEPPAAVTHRPKVGMTGLVGQGQAKLDVLGTGRETNDWRAAKDQGTLTFQRYL